VLAGRPRPDAGRRRPRAWGRSRPGVPQPERPRRLRGRRRPRHRPLSMARRRGPLGTVRGLVLAGLLAGAALVSAPAVARLVLFLRGALPPEEREAVAPMAEPGPELRQRDLLIPVQGVAAAALTDTFLDARGGGTRTHYALDIMAPRGTPVLAAEAGRVVRLHPGGAGGVTVYQLDTDGPYRFRR